MRYIGIALTLLSIVAPFAPSTVAEQVVLAINVEGVDSAREEEQVSLNLSSVSSELSKTVDVRLGRTQIIDLPPGSYELTVSSERYWAPTTIVQSPGEAHVNLLPLGTVIIPLPETEKRSEDAIESEMVLRLEECERDRSCSIAGERFPCSRLEDKLECSIPLGTYSLSLRARSYAPVYYFDVPVVAEEAMHLPKPKLTPGGSIAGFVSLADAGIDHEKVSIELLPILIKGLDPDEFRRSTVRARVAKADERGFFQFPRLPAGNYRVTAKHPGYAPYDLAPIQVYEGAESSLRKELELQRPLEVVMQIVPPVPPSGSSWSAQVSRVSEYGVGITPIDRVEKGAGDGSLIFEAPGAGEYLIEIADRDSGFRAIVPLDVSDAAVQSHELRLDLVEIGGVVTLGGEPIQADLWFGGEHGASSVHIETDHQGSFTGWLPERRHWIIEVSSESIRRTTVNMDLSKLDPKTLELKIPKNGVFGRVLDEAGQAVPGVTVAAGRTEGGVISGVTHSDGTFELLHLLGEEVTLVAWAEDGRESLPREVSIGPDSWVGPITLQLGPRTSIEVHVESAGQIVEGATVFAYPLGMTSSAQGVTNGDGVAELQISAAGGRMDVHVLAPGFPLFSQSIPSVESTLISLPHTGSNLLVRFDRDGSVPLLARNGTLLPMEVLFHWMMGQGKMLTESSEWRLDNLAPGVFEICRLDVAGGAPTLISEGAEVLHQLPCRQVSLAPGGSAEIDLRTVD